MPPKLIFDFWGISTFLNFLKIYSIYGSIKSIQFGIFLIKEYNPSIKKFRDLSKIISFSKINYFDFFPSNTISTVFRPFRMQV